MTEELNAKLNKQLEGLQRWSTQTFYGDEPISEAVRLKKKIKTLYVIIIIQALLNIALLSAAHAQDSDSNSSMGGPNTDGTVTITSYGE